MIHLPCGTTLFSPFGGSIFEEEDGQDDSFLARCWLVSRAHAVPHRRKKCGLTLLQVTSGNGARRVEVASFQVVCRCFGGRNLNAKEHRTFLLLQETSDHGGHANGCASADCKQFEVAVFLERDDGIGNTSGKVATLADFEPKLFEIVLGLGHVTDSHADVIDAPPFPEKSLGGSGRGLRGEWQGR